MEKPTSDILIVGGGIIGCALAFELAQAGRTVTILERGRPGAEATWAAGGMLAATSEHPELPAFQELGRASLQLYPEWLARLQQAAGLGDLGYRKEGTLLVAFTEAEAKELETLEGEQLSVEEARQREPLLAETILGAVYLPHDLQVDNRRLIAGLLKACQQAGVQIQSGKAAKRIVIESGRATGVELEDGSRLFAGAVVNAAGCWAGTLGEAAARLSPTRPVRGQMLSLRTRSALPRHVLRSAQAYMVPRPDGDKSEAGRVVVGSTMENVGYDKGVTPAGLRGLLAGAVQLVPALGSATFETAWAGLRPDTPDHLPTLGSTDVQNYFVAAGHFRNGILLAPITARLLAEVILGGRPSLALEPFSPLRFRASAENRP